MRKRRSKYIEGLEQRREAARQQAEQEEASEPGEAEIAATPPRENIVLKERAAPLWPSAPRRPYWK